MQEYKKGNIYHHRYYHRLAVSANKARNSIFVVSLFSQKYCATAIWNVCINVLFCCLATQCN